MLKRLLRAGLLGLALAAGPLGAEPAPDPVVTYPANGEFDEAQKAFERAVEIDPGFPPPALNLAKYAMREGRVDRARALYEQDPRLEGQQHLVAELRVLAGALQRVAETHQRVGGPFEIFFAPRRAILLYSASAEHLHKVE